MASNHKRPPAMRVAPSCCLGRRQEVLACWLKTHISPADSSPDSLPPISSVSLVPWALLDQCDFFSLKMDYWKWFVCDLMWHNLRLIKSIIYLKVKVLPNTLMEMLAIPQTYGVLCRHWAGCIKLWSPFNASSSLQNINKDHIYFMLFWK